MWGARRPVAFSMPVNQLANLLSDNPQGRPWSTIRPAQVPVQNQKSRWLS